MKIEKLWDKHFGADIYIVGTGPSIRCWRPGALRQFLKGRVSIGLNQAWVYDVGLSYSLTVHPELLLDYLDKKGKLENSAGKWIVKRKAPMDYLRTDDKDHYVFNSGTSLDLVRHRQADTLYLGRGIQCTAISLAAHMGAKAVHLLGCDMGALGGDHHAHQQHVQFHGLSSDDVYAEYRRWTTRIRTIVRDELHVPVLHVTPLLGSVSAEEDYSRHCEELGLAKLPTPVDVSKYTRDRTDP